MALDFKVELFTELDLLYQVQRVNMRTPDKMKEAAKRSQNSSVKKLKIEHIASSEQSRRQQEMMSTNQIEFYFAKKEDIRPYQDPSSSFDDENSSYKQVSSSLSSSSHKGSESDESVEMLTAQFKGIKLVNQKSSQDKVSHPDNDSLSVKDTIVIVGNQDSHSSGEEEGESLSIDSLQEMKASLGELEIEKKILEGKLVEIRKEKQHLLNEFINSEGDGDNDILDSGKASDL